MTYKTHCIRYQVDPELLKAGVPIEKLERKNVHVFQPQITLESMNLFRKTGHLIDTSKKSQSKPVTPSAAPPPPCRLISAEPPAIEVSEENYQAIWGGNSIEIPYEVSILVGEKFKIINYATGLHIQRTLEILINNRGLFR
ncbi:hypothetical protein [Aulosira sp. FACHB-615]|uniref:hypothetical protein n=1 Tax=Aulosira sp. FACHB-615 TaxID=2692777 RepID=UPI001682BB66|nr:hypothetical protein [Aulosira sp. FACHB-615]MBD2488985.1 hypothetical protein [Aulosira sp. FACHB-615]